MTNWIKFSERQPEKEGDYLYSEDGLDVRVLNWDPEKRVFDDPHTYPYDAGIFTIPDPEYWAEVTPPLVRRPGYRKIPGTEGMTMAEFLEQVAPPRIAPETNKYLF